MATTIQKDYHQTRLIILSFILFLIFYRSPELFLSPRLWAEEGILYFKYIYENSFLDGLFIIPSYTAGYYALSINLPILTFTYLLPLEYVPTATTYFSFSILLIPFIIILWGKSYLWDTVYKKILACLIILITPTAIVAEVWLNTINLQVYYGLISVIILLEKLEDIGRLKTWFYRLLLIVGGLTGAYTTFLFFAFVAKAWQEKSKESRLHVIILFITSSIQSATFLWIKYLDMLSAKKLDHVDWLQMPIHIVYHYVLLPILGQDLLEDILRQFNAFPIEHYLTDLDRASLLSLSIIVMVLIFSFLLHILWHHRKTKVAYLLVIAFIFVAVLTTYGSTFGVPKGRYTVLPSIIFLFIILNYINFTAFPKRALFFTGIIGLAFFMGIQDYKDSRHLRYHPKALTWGEQMAIWRENPDYQFHILPYPEWTFFLSRRDLLFNAKQQIANNNTFEIVSKAPNQWVEKTIAVDGLPVDFYLPFNAKLVTEDEDFRAHILFMTEDNRIHAKFPLRHRLQNNETIEIAPFSVKRGGKRMPFENRARLRYVGSNTQFQDVKAIKFRVKSSTGQPVSLSIENLSMLSQNYSIFRLVE